MNSILSPGILSLALSATLFLAATPTFAAPSEDLNELVETYYDEFLQLNPIMATFNGDHRYNDRLANSIGPDHIEASLKLETSYLARLHEIDRTALRGQDLLSYEIFERDRQEAIDGADIPQHLLPINQMFSVPTFFPQLAAPGGLQPFNTVQDYENFLGRMDGFAVWMGQAITNMREGMDKKIVHPRIIMERTLPVLASQVVDDVEDSMFFSIVNHIPDDISETDRDRITAAYRTAVESKIIASYAAVHDFIRDEYLPVCRETVGIDGIPGGREWYEFAILTHTNTNMTADEIHELGLKEVARIGAKMAELLAEIGFEGTPREFFAQIGDNRAMRFQSEQDVIGAYEMLRETVANNTPRLFHEWPEADFEIKAIEEFRQATAPGAHYMAPSPDGSRKGIFYVNTGGWEERTRAGTESLYIHEAVPGHHFQVAIARELEELPRFRRFGGNTAYSEGWGLYAESLGKDLDLYQDPYMHMGMLGSEMFRAQRLVVDTGLHSKGWTREKAIDYLRSANEVDRYMVMPGQALAYKIGELTISRLRAHAEQTLGDNFDIRDFHSQILQDGPLPLDVLEKKVTRWINEIGAAESR